MGTPQKGGVKCLEPPCGQEKKSGDNFCLQNIHSLPINRVTTKKCTKRGQQPAKIGHFCRLASLKWGANILHPLFAVTTTCCVPRQTPVRNTKNTAGKSSRGGGGTPNSAKKAGILGPKYCAPFHTFSALSGQLYGLFGPF